MRSILNIAENKSVAKELFDKLSGKGDNEQREKKDILPYEFVYTIDGEKFRMVVDHVNGHIMSYDFEDDECNEWKTNRDLINAGVRRFVKKSNFDIRDKLEKQAITCDWLILWLDCDIEGECIANDVKNICQLVNQKLKVYRARFNSLSQRDIKKAIIDATTNSLEINQAMVDAVCIRQEIEFRMSCCFTRFQTLLVESKMDVPFRFSLKYDTCMLPTLGFIVNYFEENFRKEDLKLECTHSAGGRTNKFKCWKESYFKMNGETNVTHLPNCRIAVLEDSVFKDPPSPLCTMELQLLALQHLQMNSMETMEAAETLYLSSSISYPRTDAESFPEGTRLNEILKSLKQHEQFGFYANQLLETHDYGIPDMEPSNFDHPPVYPICPEVKEFWNENEKRLYNFIVSHFLASISLIKARATERTIKVTSGKHIFSATTLTRIDEPSFTVIYPYGWKISNELSEYQESEEIELQVRVVKEDVPFMLQETGLLMKMEKGKIGTKGTRHLHIDSLIKEKYAIRGPDCTLAPTLLGRALVRGYKKMNHDLVGPCRSMIAAIENVIEGRKGKAEVLNSLKEQIRKNLQSANQNKSLFVEAMLDLKTICPESGRMDFRLLNCFQVNIA